MFTAIHKEAGLVSSTTQLIVAQAHIHGANVQRLGTARSQPEGCLLDSGAFHQTRVMTTRLVKSSRNVFIDTDTLTNQSSSKTHVLSQLYISCMSTLGTLVYIHPTGEVFKIDASKVPNFIAELDENFKKKWAPYVFARKHTLFERLDEGRDFAQMRAMLEEDEELASFLRYHMNATSGIWRWHFDVA